MGDNPPGLVKLLAALFVALFVAVYLVLVFVQWTAKPSKKK